MLRWLAHHPMAVWLLVYIAATLCGSAWGYVRP